MAPGPFEPHRVRRDPAIGPGAYAGGQVLFDRDDPAKVIDRTDKPFIEPKLAFEKTGQYKAGTVFVEGLVLFHDQWYLYYGTADTYVGVATAPHMRPPCPERDQGLPGA